MKSEIGEYDLDTKGTYEDGLAAFHKLRDLLNPVVEGSLAESPRVTYNYLCFRIYVALKLSCDSMLLGATPPSDETEGSDEVQGGDPVVRGGGSSDSWDRLCDEAHPADYGPPPTSEELRVAKSARQLAPGESIALRLSPAEKAAAEERRRLKQVRNRTGQYQRPYRSQYRRFPGRRR